MSSDYKSVLCDPTPAWKSFAYKSGASGVRRRPQVDADPAAPLCHAQCHSKGIMNRTVVAAICIVAAHGASAIELAPYAKGFSGPEGVQLVLAPSVDGKQALKARIVGQKVVFTTEESAPNQDDFVREFLRNQ